MLLTRKNTDRHPPASTSSGLLDSVTRGVRSALSATINRRSFLKRSGIGLGAGAAASWTLSNLYPRAVRGDLGPGFYAEHFLKDLRLALEEASSRGLRLPGLSLAERLYERLVAEGGGRLGTQALIQVLSSLPVTEAADEP